MMDTTQVFVYGTLKPGEINYHICERFVVAVEPAIALGQLYSLPFGYPAMTITSQEKVHGHLLTFHSTQILEILDAFEQHDPIEFVRYAPTQQLELNQYQRQKIQTFSAINEPLAPAWAYLMSNQQVNRLGGTLIRAGCWNSDR